MDRPLALAAAAGALLVLASGGLLGSSPVRVVLRPDPPPAAELVVQDVVVLRLRGLDAAARAQEVARRLVQAVARREGPPAITILPRPGEADLLLNDRHLVTADAAHAAANQTTPEGLARVWAERLTLALSRNTVTLTPELLHLRPGQTAAVAVRAFLPGPLVIGPHDERVAVASRRDGAVHVEARRPGETRVPVLVGGGQAVLLVVVRPGD